MQLSLEAAIEKLNYAITNEKFDHSTKARSDDEIAALMPSLLHGYTSIDTLLAVSLSA